MDTAHNTRHAKHGTHTHHSATPRQHTRGWTRDPAPHTLHYSRVWAEKLRPCAHESPQRRVTPACTHPPLTVSRASVMPREFESPDYRACGSARAREDAADSLTEPSLIAAAPPAYAHEV